MICPACGSRDVDFESLFSGRQHLCNCNNCPNEWVQESGGDTANKIAAGDDKK